MIKDDSEVWVVFKFETWTGIENNETKNFIIDLWIWTMSDVYKR